MKRNNKKKILIILLLLVVGISIGYAALTTTLNINGNTKIEKASWNIHFENLVKTTGSETATVEASIDDTKTLIEYTVTLAEPGDFYEFTVDIVNNGTIDAMISEVLKEGLSSDQEKYIEYSATYSDGIALEEKDYLKSNETQNIRVRVKYREDISSEDLPTEETSLNLSFSVTYIQADESAKERTVAICRRATTLHTEKCDKSDAKCFNDGYVSEEDSMYVGDKYKGTNIVTYGSLGTLGQFTAGDAFDCDVNGDGSYDSETERFYYVTDLDSDNDYAVLIYYNNVNDGLISNSTQVKNYGNADNSVGYPAESVLELPTNKQWKNVSLSNPIRDIKNLFGELVYTGFSYEGYSTRFLTADEVVDACDLTLSDGGHGAVSTLFEGCEFLKENTYYAIADQTSIGGYWLENAIDESVYYTPDEPLISRFFAYAIDVCSNAIVAKGGDSNIYGVRPVIEVPKSSILY